MAVGDERSEARERALNLLYEAASRSVDPCEALAGQPIEADLLTGALVRGISANLDRIDGLIDGRSDGWALARMPLVDLCVMRLGVYELLERDDVPVAVILDEAVDLAQRFSTENSGRFVNGVLAAIARDLGRLERDVAG
jgi:N utilization substance protein B